MEILTFIQFRHRADNSLSKPMQKAATTNLIATRGLATVVQADMVTPTSGEKTRSVVKVATHAAATASEPSEC